MSIPQFDPDKATVGSLFEVLKNTGAQIMSMALSEGKEEDAHAAVVLIRGEKTCRRILKLIREHEAARGSRTLDIHQGEE